MGMASTSNGWMDAYDTACAAYTNTPPGDPPQPPTPRRRKRAKARQKTVEHLYADLIKAGLVRIERKKGQPPKIVWL